MYVLVASSLSAKMRGSNIRNENKKKVLYKYSPFSNSKASAKTKAVISSILNPAVATHLSIAFGLSSFSLSISAKEPTEMAGCANLVGFYFSFWPSKYSFRKSYLRIWLASSN